ncbi:hypothetical protein SERRSCBI_23986 (plasmid) [Serratia sp. SCBI]|nr:hypothetical protein SERRSCBI_23986 [Serratia sp. SCBI]
MRALTLRYFIMRLWLHRMDKVRELNRILNEKYGRIITYEIKIAFFSIEFCCPASNISYRISRASGALDGRKTHKDRCFNTGILKEFGSGIGG